MIPIPSDASIRDARWEPAFLQLAHGLVRLAAKSRVIQRFTGVSVTSSQHAVSRAWAGQVPGRTNDSRIRPLLRDSEHMDLVEVERPMRSLYRLL